MAQAQSLARISQQPSYDAIAQGQQYAQMVYQAQLQRSQAINAALQGLTGGIGGQMQAQGNQAAQSQSTFAKGYSDGLKALTGASADQANQFLGNVVGAPAGQMISGSQATDTGDVLGMLGGKLPAEMFKAQGAGYAQAAQRFPMEAAAQQKIQQVGAEQQYGATSADFANQIAALAKQNPLVAAQYLDELYTQQRQDRQDFTQQQQYTEQTAYQRQQDAKGQAMSMYNAGFMTQRQLAQQLGLNGTYPNQTKDQLAANAPILQKVGNTLLRIDPKTQTATVIWQGAGTDTHPSTFTAPDGAVHAWVKDPTTNQWTAPAITQPKPGAASKPPATVTLPDGSLGVWQKTGKTWHIVPITGPKPTTATDSIHYYRDAAGREHGFNAQTGVDVVISPPGAVAPRPPKFTPMQITAFKSDAADTARDAFYGVSRVDKATGQTVWDVTPQHYQQAITDMLDHGIPLVIAQNALNRYWKRPGYDADVAARQKGQTVWFRAGTGRPSRPYQQRVGPKGDASAEPGAAGALLVSYAKQQLGQKYVWGAESRKEGGFDCSGLVDYAMRQEGYSGPRVTTWTIASMGQSVKGQPLAPGDLIITNGGKHVVMYAGGNQVIAGSSAKGKVVMQPLSQFKQEDVRRLDLQPSTTRVIPGLATPEPMSWKGKKQLASTDLQQLWMDAGGSPQLAQTMAAIALAESHGKVGAFNPRGQDYSVGLWQINYHGGMRGPRTKKYGTPEQLRRDAFANARAAVDLAQGGAGLSNWSTYTSGAYRQYL